MVKDSYDYFVAAYEAPNFSVAASRIPMSPQGFAKAIRGLEKDLGVPLFQQDDAGKRCPTPYADELYRFARHMQAERNLLLGQFEKIAAQQRTSIRLVASLGVLGMLGADFVRQFEHKHANVDVLVTEVPDATCDRLLLDGVFDLALNILPVVDDLETVPLYSTGTEIWVRCDHPLAGNQRVCANQLAGERLAMPGNYFKCRSAMQRLCKDAGARLPRFVDYSEIFWIYDFVQKGRGLGFTLPHLSALAAFRSDERVRAIPLTGLTWSFGVSWMRGRPLHATETEFVNHLKARARTLDGNRLAS